MGLRINIPLPGPFSYSVPTPSPAKAMRKAIREDRARMVAVEREVPGPVQRGGRVTDDTDWGAAILWGLVVAILLVLAIAGFAGFRV